MFNLYALGIVLIIVGLIIFVIGYVYGSWMAWNCSANGCGDIFDTQVNYPVRYPLMIIGTSMMVTGIVFVVKTRIRSIKV